MTYINEAKFTGKIQRSAQTKGKTTGLPTLKITLACGKETIHAVLLGELAESISPADGEWIEIKGSVHTSSWDGLDGIRRFGWYCLAKKIRSIPESVHCSDVPPTERSTKI
ncbi:MAG: hypothetical protein J0652_01075 [Desulfobulbaceae bacterium]|nr:hypothetical protein [Desulfobulbaceae bacterium]